MALCEEGAAAVTSPSAERNPVPPLQSECLQDCIFHGEIDDFIKGNGYSPPRAPRRNNVMSETH